jgi:hypothetical protein
MTGIKSNGQTLAAQAVEERKKAALLQGCQIFLDTMYQNLGKYSK